MGNVSDEQWWLVWVLIGGHLAWSALNWWVYFKAKRIRHEAEDMLLERRQMQEWHAVKWGER